MECVGASEAMIGIKDKYHDVIDAITRQLEEEADLKVYAAYRERFESQRGTEEDQ